MSSIPPSDVVQIQYNRVSVSESISLIASIVQSQASFRSASTILSSTLFSRTGTVTIRSSLPFCFSRYDQWPHLVPEYCCKLSYLDWDLNPVLIYCFEWPLLARFIIIFWLNILFGKENYSKASLVFLFFSVTFCQLNFILTSKDF